jgi:dTMP kinase
MYIVFEGVVGTGKSTQAKSLLAYLQGKYPEKEVVLVREPGGTAIAESIRTLVQATEFDEEMHALTDAYLYAAARAQLIHTYIKPVLDA